MNLEVRLRPEAEEDLADAAAWYEKQRPDETYFLSFIISRSPLQVGSPAPCKISWAASNKPSARVG